MALASVHGRRAGGMGIMALPSAGGYSLPLHSRPGAFASASCLRLRVRTAGRVRVCLHSRTLRVRAGADGGLTRRAWGPTLYSG